METHISTSTRLIGEMTSIVTVGIDLAKNVFALHCVDEAGNPAQVRPEVPRAKPLERLDQLPPGPRVCQAGPRRAAFGAEVRSLSPRDSTTMEFCLTKVD